MKPEASHPPLPELRKHEKDAMLEEELVAEGKAWFVLEVDAQHELRVRYELRQRGIEAFCMVRTRWVKPHRYTRRVMEKPFAEVPRYVFVGFPPDGAVPWGEIRDVDHVRGPLGIHGRPSPVRPGDVQRLMDDQMRGKWRAANRDRRAIDRFLKVGDIIPAGALRIPVEPGAEVTVKSMRGGKAFLEGLGMLGATVVQVDLAAFDVGKLRAR